jgi:hypothetical protein
MGQPLRGWPMRAWFASTQPGKLDGDAVLTHDRHGCVPGLVRVPMAETGAG